MRLIAEAVRLKSRVSFQLMHSSPHAHLSNLLQHAANYSPARSSSFSLSPLHGRHDSKTTKYPLNIWTQQFLEIWDLADVSSAQLSAAMELNSSLKNTGARRGSLLPSAPLFHLQGFVGAVGWNDAVCWIEMSSRLCDQFLSFFLSLLLYSLPPLIIATAVNSPDVRSVCA